MTLDERVPRCYHEENLKTEEKTMKKFFAIILSALMLMSLLTGCSKEVTVDAAGLQHMSLEGAVTAMTKEGYTAKLIPQEHYVLPETITVTMEDQKEQTYTYDPATGEQLDLTDVLTDLDDLPSILTKKITQKYDFPCNYLFLFSLCYNY